MGISILFLFTVANLVLAVIVFARNRKSVVNRGFFAMTIGISLWAVTNAFFQLAGSESWGYIWAILAYESGIVLVIGGFIFSSHFPYELGVFGKKKNLVVGIPGAVIGFLMFIPGFAVNHVDFLGDTRQIVVSPGVYILFAYLLILFLIIVYNFIKNYSLSRGIYRAQMRWILYGTVISIIGGTILNIILPALGNYRYVVYGPYFTIFLIGGIAYSITRYRLLDVRYIFNKMLVALLMGGAAFGAYYLVTWVQTSLWSTVWNSSAYLSGVLIALVFGLVYSLFERFVKVTVVKSLVKEEYNEEKLRKDFGQVFNSVADLGLLVDKTMTLLSSGFGVRYVYVILSTSNERETLCFENTLTDPLEESVKVSISDIGIYQGLSGVTLKEEVIEQPVGSKARVLLPFIEKKNIAALLPLSIGKRVIGACFLGEKLSEGPYNITDIEFVEGIGVQFSVAVERAKLYTEAQQFNVKLQHEVDVATKKLKVQNEQLKELDKMKDDLISIAGHELRTPATVAKGNLYLLKKKINAPDRIKYLEKAEDAIEREGELVTILLEASRIGKDTLELIVEPLRLEELAKEAVEDHTSAAEKKGLSLTYKEPEAPLSQIYGDKTRIREISDNLITNAIKYTEKGSIRVWTEEKDEKVWFHIQDTGVGIPADEIQNLFQKFYRVRNYTSGTKHLLRPGGTGLGLYVSKNLAKRHGGDVLVESEVNVGSTFSFYIPLSFKGNLGAVKDLPKDHGEQDLFKVMGLSRKGSVISPQSVNTDTIVPREMNSAAIVTAAVDANADVTVIRQQVPVSTQIPSTSVTKRKPGSRKRKSPKVKK